MRLVSMPLQALGTAVRQVYYQKTSEMKIKGEELRSPLLRMSGLLFCLGMVPFGMLILFGEEAFRFILGDPWAEAGRYASILAPWLFSALLIAPSQVTIVVLRRQALWFRFQIYLMVLRISVFGVGYVVALEAAEVLAVFSAVSTLFNILMIAVTFRTLGSQASK